MEQGTTPAPDHQDMSARIERATLESMAGEVPTPPGLAPPAPDRKYPYSQEDADAYAGMFAPGLAVWSSRWTVAEPLNETEIDMLSEAVGRFLAWKFPGNGEESHPTAALMFAVLGVSIPRGFQLWAAKQAAKEAAEKAAKEAAEKGQGHVGAAH